MEWICRREEFWDKYTQEFRCTLWGTDAWFCIGYTNAKDGRDCQEQLARFAATADHCLGWLNTHQKEIYDAIEEDGLYDTAVEWLEDNETEEEDGVTYALLYDGARLPLPYRKEDFFSSLLSSGLDFSADFKSTKFILDMFLSTEPDIFGGHSIEIFLKGDFSQDTPTYSISVNGLAG